MKIISKKGLEIPIQGEPTGEPQPLPHPHQIALNLAPFDDLRFRVLIKVGDPVKIGEPLVESKRVPGQMFVSPASGVVTEVRRGLKRRLLDIVVDVDKEESYQNHPHPDLEKASREELIDLFMRSGLFPHIRLRPFDLIPDPKFNPRSIFVSAVETRPFAPPFALQIKGNDTYFQAGLKALSKMTTGKVHLVFHEGSDFSVPEEGGKIAVHTIQGPHPAGSSSVHIHAIDPIRNPQDYVWSLTALGVVIIGKMVLEGRYFIQRIIGVAGTGILPEKRGYFLGREGFPIQDLVANRLTQQPVRLISGDPLSGIEVHQNDFLGFYHTCFSAIPENFQREPFHFFRLGAKKYSATRTYLSGHLPPPPEGYPFTTNQHGEKRAFIDPSVYEKVMPMNIPTMHLIKAILAEDFEQAEQLGLLEVTAEDFVLPTFICPSKIEMVEIVKQGLYRYAKEMGH
jgi:Na+-transporting NADH:ubiquinone oxidoreductase subunit A